MALTGRDKAFSEARKKGLKKFKYNGNWYTTETAEEKKGATHGSVTKVNLNDKVSKVAYDKNNRAIGAKNLNRIQIQPVENPSGGTLYQLIDVETGTIYKTSKDAKDLLKWASQNKDAFGEATGTAQYTKINRNTPGIIPVDNSDLIDKNGNTRVYKNYETGQYFVTDNYGYVIGDSFDPNAETKGFKGWNIFTGNKKDLARAGSGRIKTLANMNEVNQLDLLQFERLTDEYDRRVRGLQRALGMFNTALHFLNLPNNIIAGGLRTLRDDFTLKDYANSFDLDHIWRGENQTVGLGDLVGIENPYGRFAANLVNPMSLVGAYGKSNKTTTQNKPVRIKANNHELGSYTYTTPVGKTINSTRGQIRYVGDAMPEFRGKYIGNIEGKGKMLPTTGSRSTLFATLGKNNGLVTTYGSGPARIQSPSQMAFEYSGMYRDKPSMLNMNFQKGSYSIPVGNRTVLTEPHVGTYHIPGTTSFYIPGATSTNYSIAVPLVNSAFNYTDTPRYVQPVETVPTADFYYENGPENRTVISRIETGDFVPGTTSPNWNGNIHGGKLRVINTKNHESPTFGGVTTGKGKDNKSNLYLYGSYKHGGKLLKRNKYAVR